MNKYVERLLEEWKQYGKIIIAVDYDDTISPWKLTQANIDETGIVDLLKQVQLTGAYIVCFTACDKSRYQEIQSKFSSLGLILDKINENPIALPYGNQNKIYANIFLDDRAGLIESLSILEEALYKYRGFLQSKLTSSDME
jgi:hypothetical protein